MANKEINLIIDRFEGSFAVCEQEDGGFQTIPRFDLPKNCKEGECITFKDNTFRIDHKKTRQRKKTIQDKLNSLFD